jgi:hypothetical protein
MPKIPTPEELGGLLRMPGSRPIGRYDVSPYAQGAQQIANAGARFGQAVEDVGKETNKAAERQRMLTEATVAGTYINGRLLAARDRFRNDPDYATLPQRWADEAGTIFQNGLSLVSNDGLRDRVSAEVTPSLQQERALIQDQAFRGAADAHAANREGFLQHVLRHITLDPNDATTTGAIDSYHANVDDAVSRGYLTPEQAATEKRSAALRLTTAEYALMARRDPERAMRELQSTDHPDPVVAALPQEQKDALIREAQRRQDGAAADTARAAMLAHQRAQRASDEAEHATVRELLAGNPSVTSGAILDNAVLKDDAKDRVLKALAHSTQPEPPAEVSDATAVALLDRIRRPDGDAEKIAAIDPIVDAYSSGKLAKANLDFIARQLDEGQMPAGAAIASRKQALIDDIQPLIDEQAREGGLPAASQRLALERDIDGTIQQYLAEGKNPRDVFSPFKASYLGTPGALQPYIKNISSFSAGASRNDADWGDDQLPPFGTPPSPSEVWQREFIRGHLELYRRARALADYLRGVFNKPTDDKEPGKEKKEPDEPPSRTEGPTPDPNEGPTAPPPWRQFELKHGSKQTRVTIERDGKVSKFGLDYPVNEEGIVDLKDYNWEKSAYDKPFIRNNVVDDFKTQIKNYIQIHPKVVFRFSKEPPSWIVEAIKEAGGNFVVKP